MAGYVSGDGDKDCSSEIADSCPFRGCVKRPGAPHRTLDILGACHRADCPKDEVEEILRTMDILHKQVGTYGIFRMAFTLPEAKARMALALAVARYSDGKNGEPDKQD